jgi:hypothetical protein
MQAHHQAEVQDADFAVWRPQQVPRVRVRVQQPRLQQLHVDTSTSVLKYVQWHLSAS